jgi:hypothetical protein
MTYTRWHTRPSQKDLARVVYPLNNKSLRRTLHGSSVSHTQSHSHPRITPSPSFISINTQTERDNENFGSFLTRVAPSLLSKSCPYFCVVSHRVTSLMFVLSPGWYSKTGYHIDMDCNFVCLWRRHNCRSQVIDLSLSALISWFMKSIIGFLNNYDLNAIISTLFLTNLHWV